MNESQEKKLKFIEKRDAFAQQIKILNQIKFERQKYQQPKEYKKISQRQKALEFAKNIQLPRKKNQIHFVSISPKEKNIDKEVNELEFYAKKHKEFIEKIKKLI